MKKTKQAPNRRVTANGRPDPTWTVARLSKYFGVPPERLILHPRPGMATEDDLLYVNAHDRLCELVDGVLVEKALSFRESFLAGLLIYLISDYLKKHDRGIVLSPDGTMQLFPGLIRAPDVSFISWTRFPHGEFPEKPVPDLAPDLAVEVLSKSNSKKEMDRKVGEYFANGVSLVWLLDPRKRTATVYKSPADHHLVKSGEILDGGDVLPGFSLDLERFFTLPKSPDAR